MSWNNSNPIDHRKPAGGPYWPRPLVPRALIKAALAKLLLIIYAGGAGGVLTGCGYQLRGSDSLPIELSRIYVQTQTNALYRAVALMLDGTGAELVKNRKDAVAVILVNGEDLSERLLSVDPNTGKAREYELSFAAVFSVRGNNGESLVDRQRVRVVRDYVFDSDAVIGKSRERGVLEAEMRRDAVQQIFNRIRAAYRARS